MSTLKMVYSSAVTELKTARVSSPFLEARLLTCHVLGLKEHELITKEDLRVPYFKMRQLKKLLYKRGKGCPHAYLVKKKEFFGRDFLVTGDVLIPRPETEELLEWVIHEHRDWQNIRMLDLGAGSGCIGITFALELAPSIQEVCFSDINPKAMQVLRKNHTRLLRNSAQDHSGIEFFFIRSDLFASEKFISKKFDLILSNPPYILEDEIPFLSREVADHEPRQALIVPNKNFLRRLLREAFRHLRTGGYLYLENNPRVIEEIALDMKEVGFKKIELREDLSLKKRFIRGVKPASSTP